MRVKRTIPTGRPRETVFAYMSDFENTEDWDPGTVSTTLIEGDGGVGTRYRNVSRFLGRETELEYEVVAFEPGESIHLRGTNSTVVADDRISVADIAGGSEIEYDANFSFKGVARWLAPLFAPALKRLGDRAERRLTELMG